ncbi:MAG: NUDIX hydrolase [Candidatus Krumholzibacteriota bacterium]|nr:NUDIX hydrolase [Candidatus Krumholzibacteriota bacterium]
MTEPFEYCPRCRSALQPVEEEEGRIRMRCPDCGFVDYHNPAPAAGVLLRDGGRVLLVRRRFDPFRGLWTIPSGYIEYEEDVRGTAVREVREETGLEIDLGPVIGAVSCHDDPRGNTLLVLFGAEVTGGEAVAGDDADDIGWFAPGDLPPIAFACQRRLLSSILGVDIPPVA